MKKPLLIICLLLFWVTPNASELVQSAALVNQNSMSQLEQENQALAAVVSRHTGLSVKNVQGDVSLLNSLRSSVLRRYFDRPNVSTGDGSLWYHLVLDQKKMEQQLLAAGLPIWPPQRPKVSVWMVEESSDAGLSDSDLAFSAADSEAVYWLKQWFKHRGIQADFQRTDSNDLLQFEPSDVRYLNPDLIDVAEEMDPDAWTLLIFVKHNPSGYAYRFGLKKPGHEVSLNSRQFIDLASGMEALVNGLQQMMAKGRQIQARDYSPQTVSIQINGINEAGRLLSVADYLDNHVLIDQYQINQYQSHQLQLTAMIKVKQDTFIDYIDQDGVLMHQPVGLGARLLFTMLP